MWTLSNGGFWVWNCQTSVHRPGKTVSSWLSTGSVLTRAVVLDDGLTIEDFSEETGIVLPDGDYETVAGYVLARLGRVAEVGDEVALDGALLRVVAVDGRRLTDVEVVPPAVGE